jgi:tetratricopeptide (TPR) repeat protein
MEAYCDALHQPCQMPEIRKKILSNRALINSWLKNHGKVVEDCLNAISLDKTFMRPYLRAIEALINLSKWRKALKMIDRAEQQEEENFAEASKGKKLKKTTWGNFKELAKMRTSANTGLKKIQAKEKAKAAKLAAKTSRVALKCVEKGVVLGEMSNFALPDIYTRELKVQDDMLIT